jgi:hypothetical protein
MQCPFCGRQVGIVLWRVTFYNMPIPSHEKHRTKSAIGRVQRLVHPRPKK